ncbi:MAG TPA: hypothetical protein VHZ95_05295, partial [Polyangiales bacterium]|nr:hypothetical protein [Polyangiales bacterium]
MAVTRWSSFALLLTACTVDDGFSAVRDQAYDADNSSGVTLAQLTGSFALSLGDDSNATRLTGTILGGSVESAPLWVLSRKQNGCILDMARPTCEPACASAEVCSQQLECIPSPKRMNVGTIQVSGLASAVTLSSNKGRYALPSGTALPMPPCSAGNAITLAADGGPFRAFKLASLCVDPLNFDGDIHVERQTPLVVTWEKGVVGARVQLEIATDVDSEQPARIFCDVADSGTVTIDADMLELLYKLGVGGTPTMTMTRILEGGTTGNEPSQVAFTVQQRATRSFSIPG